MARADLLKSLFRSFKTNDTQGFMQAAMSIIDEERKKNHLVLAEELQRIITGNIKNGFGSINMYQPPLPQDSDKKVPLFEIKYPDRYLSDLVVTDKQKKLLETIITEYRSWDLLEHHSLTPNHKILFYGPPGCGKTMTAEALAGELQIPLLYVRFDAVVSSFLGETSANIRKVFDYASRGSWVIFFDEFDAIGRSRDDGSEHGEIKRVVNAFLQLLDNFRGKSLIIAATNYEKSLDYALWRRFHEIVRFDLPNREQIYELLRRSLSRLPGQDSVLNQVADELVGLSHAEVQRICGDVLKKCIIEGKPYYHRADLEDAIRREKYRLEARLSGETKDKRRGDEK
jgi:SpoVK/Ycf46/Vps4 family AAA+-type ATPase